MDLQKIRAIAISLHGQQIGIINRLPGDRYIFTFEQNYIDNPNRPTLSLSFKGQQGALVHSLRQFNFRLPPFFSNLLPEGHLRTYLAQKAEVKSEREFFLLAALCNDLPGAVTATLLDANTYTDKSHTEHAGEHYTDTALRFSLAGVQLKFSAIMEAKGGLTIPANGMGGSWIIKLPSTRFNAVPENEFVMLALARAIGIVLPQNRLIDINKIRGLPKDIANMNESRVLAVERFDRGPNGQRIHMEDFAQIFGLFPDDKYDHRSYANIAAVLSAETGEVGVHEFVRRLVFSIMIGNADMHLKNWSVLYPDTRIPILSPAYDLVSTLPYIPNDKLALNFGGSRSLDEITLDQIRRFADTARLSMSPILDIVRETIENTILGWKNLPEKELLPNDMRKVIHHQIMTVAKNANHLFTIK